MIHTGYTLNRVHFTFDEEQCILHFLRQAEESEDSSVNESWHPVIRSIFRKYHDSDVKEAHTLD